MKTKATYFVLCFVLLAACQDPKIKEIARLEELYLIARKSNDPIEAIRLRRSIQNLDPNEPSNLDSLALLYYSIGDYPSTLNVADSAIDIIPKAQTLRIGIEAAKQLRHYSKGKQYVELYLALTKSNDVEVSFENAWFALGLQQYEECIKILEGIIRQPSVKNHYRTESIDGVERSIPLTAICYNMLGACYYNLGELKQSEIQFKNALLEAPYYASAEANLIELEKSQQTFENRITN